MTKQCIKCKLHLNKSLYFKKAASPDGLQYTCKGCSLKQQRQWRLDNPDKYKEQNKRRKVKTPAQSKKAKLRSKKSRHEMSDKYIRELICKRTFLDKDQIPDEMVKMWRLNLKLKRALNLNPELKNTD